MSNLSAATLPPVEIDNSDDPPMTREEWEAVPRHTRDGLADFFLRMAEEENETERRVA